MSSRFTSNLTLAILGAVLVTMSLALRPPTVGWVAFGVGCATVALTLIAFAMRGRGRLQRALDVTVMVLGAWTIISARTISAAALRWLCFSEAVALLGLTVVGLIGHEVIVQRQLRSIQNVGERDDGRPVKLEQRFPEPPRVTAW